MVRRVAVLGLAGGLVAAAGCRNSCGDRGWFTSAGRGSAPCGLVGRPGGAEACDVPLGVPVSGGGLPPGSAGTLIPGSGGTMELPPPAGLIPATDLPGTPFAPPKSAPADYGGVGALPAPKVGVPVKGGN